nr:hypothetical protein [Tanacetum cinerariifolium]
TREARHRAQQKGHWQDLLHPRRADHRPALRGHPPPGRRAAQARRQGQYRPHHRAQPRPHQGGRPRHRHRPRGRRGRRHHRGPGHARAVLLSGAGCSSKPDSVEQAQQTNAATMGDRDSTAAAAVNEKEGEEGPAFDSKFLTKAASGGMLEVQLGQQIIQKAITPDAKSFAQQMVTDHTKANEELKSLAAKKNIVLPTTLGKDQQKVYDDVLAEKGIELDKKYISAMLDDHKEDIAEYQEAVTKASDADIKTFAQKNVPVLEMHLGMAQKIQPVVEAKK